MRHDIFSRSFGSPFCQRTSHLSSILKGRYLFANRWLTFISGITVDAWRRMEGGEKVGRPGGIRFNFPVPEIISLECFLYQDRNTCCKTILIMEIYQVEKVSCNVTVCKLFSKFGFLNLRWMFFFFIYRNKGIIHLN